MNDCVCLAIYFNLKLAETNFYKLGTKLIPLETSF